MLYFLYTHSATTNIYTLSLHDALPISCCKSREVSRDREWSLRGRSARDNGRRKKPARRRPAQDRKSTRLNSSHVEISYAVFCLKKKKCNKKYPILRIVTSILHPSA